jgi:hypothetical protein
MDAPPEWEGGSPWSNNARKTRRKVGFQPPNDGFSPQTSLGIMTCDFYMVSR